MNEYDQGTQPLEPYKDRSTGLIVFGILTMGLGCLCELFILLMLAGQAIAAANPQAQQVDSAALLPAFTLYGVLGVVLVWLGVGSIMARRWARALLLVFSWSWLVMGTFVMVVFAIIMMVVMPTGAANLPATGTPPHPALPTAAMGAVLFVVFLVEGFIFIVLPAIWTFFYNSRHVKATCDARNPASCWTDACPLPVLGLCLWLLLCMPMMAITPLTGHGVVPFFGMFLTGISGALYYLAITAIWGCSAWLLYRLDVRGWWLLLITVVLFSVSGVLTFMRHDVLEMYRLMGYADAQTEQIKKIGLFEGNRMAWMMAVGMAPFLGYILFIKRYFRR